LTRVAEPWYTSKKKDKWLQLDPNKQRCKRKAVIMMANRISFSRGRGKLSHNNRDKISANIDQERMKNNISLVNQPLDKAYQKVFGKALEMYNSKQKRNDRKIENYFTKLFGEENYDTVLKNSNKQQSFYEYVVGIGDKDTTGYSSNPEMAKLAEMCLKEYFYGVENKIQSFEERNPNFHVFNAIIHCDEATPHLHFDFIPFADGYKKGMTRQQGIAKALEQMDYGTGEDAIYKFTQSERMVFKKICESHGIDVAEEQKGRGYTIPTQQYGERKDNERIILEQQQEIAILEQQIIQQEQTVKELQDKALAYQQPTKKPLESKHSYEERLAIQQQATAILQREEDVIKEELRITQFEERVKNLDAEVQKAIVGLKDDSKKLEHNKNVFEVEKKEFEEKKPLIISAETRLQVQKILDKNNIQFPDHLLNENIRIQNQQLQQSVSISRQKGR